MGSRVEKVALEWVAYPGDQIRRNDEEPVLPLSRIVR